MTPSIPFKKVLLPRRHDGKSNCQAFLLARKIPISFTTAFKDRAWFSLGKKPEVVLVEMTHKSYTRALDPYTVLHYVLHVTVVDICVGRVLAHGWLTDADITA